MKEESLYDEMFSEDNMWFPRECFDCKHWWMGRADVKCPECGSTNIGVAGCPEGGLAIDTKSERME